MPGGRPTKEDEPNKGGRPSLYTPELAAELFQRLCEPRSLRSVCEDPDMPHRRTVLGWVVNDEEGKAWHGFSHQYALARQVQAHIWAEEVTDIADNEDRDWAVDENGNLNVQGEHIQRSKLRVDTRKWLLSKVLPKVYGDKVALTHTGKDGGPIEVSDARQKLEKRLDGMGGRLAGFTGVDESGAHGNGNGKSG